MTMSNVRTSLSALSRGVGGTEKNLIQGGSAPRSDPLPFRIPFLAENVPLSYTFHWKIVPFHI